MKDKKTEDDIVMMNIKVPKSIRKEIKQLALDKDVTMTSIFMEAIELYKKKNQ